MPPKHPPTDAIKDEVLEIVAEKTGYPKDMLDLDLDLEADLGVDTVKQAEMFAAIRAAYNIPRDPNLKLRDFPTLTHVIKFARDRAGLAAAAPEEKPESTNQAAKAAVSPVAATPPRIVRPCSPVWTPPIAFHVAFRCRSCGRHLPCASPPASHSNLGRRVVIMPDKGGVADALAQQLQAMGVEVLRIDGTPDADALTGRLKQWMASGPVQGIYWLPALDNEGQLSRYGSCHLARSGPRAPEIALHNHARFVRTGREARHVPRLGDATRRTARLRRRRSSRLRWAEL